MEIKEKCGECDFFISLKYDTKASGCSLDWDKTTSYNDDPCEEYKQCQMGIEVKKRLGIKEEKE